MAKPRKNYHKNKPAWQWIIFYILVGGVIFSLLYYSGIISLDRFKISTNPEREVEIYQ